MPGGAVVPSVEESLQVWRTRNACEEPTVEEVGEVTRTFWSCARGTAVELITVDSLGHPWAGSAIYPSRATCGGSTTDRIFATDELLRFFEAHPAP
ncbi:MAG TPA: hypothetical protein RMG48_07300 [Myxococcales bacterium LLY-WYZ-16_1]|nr:hypothetical protein [Myxococcales bacterium LLY-WYZ-16_1]